MASGYTIKISGLDKALKKVNGMAPAISQMADMEMDAACEVFVGRAVSDAPVDQGQLRSGISKNKVGFIHYEVVSAAEHSAAMEFGTRTRVVIPAELSAYASQFKGMKGSGDAKRKIYEWCKRVGIEPKFWFSIFKKIMTVGVNPHPFFFKQREPVASELEKRIRSGAKKILRA